MIFKIDFILSFELKSWVLVCILEWVRAVRLNVVAESVHEVLKMSTYFVVLQVEPELKDLKKTFPDKMDLVVFKASISVHDLTNFELADDGKDL